jgi:hypothetical protein
VDFVSDDDTDEDEDDDDDDELWESAKAPNLTGSTNDSTVPELDCR